MWGLLRLLSSLSPPPPLAAAAPPPAQRPAVVLPLSRPAHPCVHRGWYVISSRAAVVARPLSRPPPAAAAPALTVPERSVACGGGAAVGPRVPPRFLGPRVSAPLLSGYLAVAFRRGGLKTPGGSPFRPRGRGAVGPVGSCRSGGASRFLLLARPALPQTRRPPPVAAAPEAAVGGRVASPLWAPVGPAPRARRSRSCGLPARGPRGSRVACAPPFRLRP